MSDSDDSCQFTTFSANLVIPRKVTFLVPNPSEGFKFTEKKNWEISIVWLRQGLVIFNGYLLKKTFLKFAFFLFRTVEPFAKNVAENQIYY